MTPKQILSASLLDIIFDDRNKAYGAYDLRVTYPQRIKKSLLFTFAVAILAFAGAALASSMKPDKPAKLQYTEMTLSDVDLEVEKPKPLPEPEKKPEPVKVQTEKLTQFMVVEDDQVQKPPPSRDDLVDVRISDFQQDGIPDERIVTPEILDDGKKIIEEDKGTKDEGPFTSVEIDAKYSGNWAKFLTQQLNPDVPVDNGAPAGIYKVIIQFVVDLEGNVSDIRPLTNLGYGMEQEAIRVLKKATKWEPAVQNGTYVKAYRKQPIIFEVVDGD